MKDRSKRSVGARISLTVRGFLVMIAGLSGSAVQASVLPFETAVGVMVRAQINPVPTATSDTQIGLGHDISPLSVHAFAASGVGLVNSVDSDTQATLSFTSAENGTVSTSWRANTYGPHSSSAGHAEEYALVPVPESLFNAFPNARPPAVTYAFYVGGSGSIAIDWTFVTGDSRNTPGENLFFYGRRAIAIPASVEVWHAGSIVDSLNAALVPLYSSGSTNLPFSAAEGDKVLLRLLPQMAMAYSASGASPGQFVQDLTVNFAITSVPEPSSPVMLGAGLTCLACLARRRPTRR